MKTFNLCVPVSTLLVAVAFGSTAFAEPTDQWANNFGNAPSFNRSAAVATVTAAAPPSLVALLPTSLTNLPTASTTTTPPAPIMPVAMHSSYSTIGDVATATNMTATNTIGSSTPTVMNAAPIIINPNAGNPSSISSAPTITVDTAPVPKASQRELDERLWLSALAGNLGALQSLIAEGANPQVRTRYGETAVHAAAARGHTLIVDFLIKKGVSIHSRTSNGWTALHHAARFGQVSVANYLIKAGADPRLHTSDAGRKTPIDIAIDKRDLRMARILGY